MTDLESKLDTFDKILGIAGKASDLGQKVITQSSDTINTVANQHQERLTSFFRHIGLFAIILCVICSIVVVCASIISGVAALIWSKTGSHSTNKNNKNQ